METKHLRYVDATHAVWLKASGDRDAEPLGYLSDGTDAAPVGMVAEWLELADMVRDGERYATACERTATATDLDPKGWR